MIRTIVLDDEWYSLREVCGLAEKTGFMTVAGAYTDPLAALAEAPSLRPQVALIDIEMPEMDGLAFAQHLVALHPGVLLAFISGWNHYAVKAFELNALDYVMKPVREERFQKLAEKLRAEVVRMERSTYAERILALYERQSGGAAQDPPVRLTEREAQVLALLARGMTQREMAGCLFLSVSSIKKHLESIYAKFCVNNKISAVQKAREAGIL